MTSTPGDVRAADGDPFGATGSRRPLIATPAARYSRTSHDDVLAALAESCAT